MAIDELVVGTIRGGSDATSGLTANPATGRAFDLLVADGGRIVEDSASLAQVGRETVELIRRVAAGQPTVSEAFGHQEFILKYKSFEPLGPSCLPLAS